MKSLGLWFVFFIPALLIELVCYVLAPLVALFSVQEERTDVVKRLNKEVVTMQREYLPRWLILFQTHDNALDEWWYGMYNVDHWFKFAREWTQEDYDSKWLVRYYCRLMWLWRNCAYGFHYAWFSRPNEISRLAYEYCKESEGFWFLLNIRDSSFQFEAHLPSQVFIWSAILSEWLAYFFGFPTVMLVTSMLAIVAIFWLRNRYISINIGWKAHKNIPRLLYANRIISFRSYE